MGVIIYHAGLKLNHVSKRGPWYLHMWFGPCCTWFQSHACKLPIILLVSVDHSCQFESSLCGWESVGQLGGFLADLSWRRHSRHLGPVGPLHDRSSTDGSKWFWGTSTHCDHNGHSPRQTVWMASELLDISFIIILIYNPKTVKPLTLPFVMMTAV